MAAEVFHFRLVLLGSHGTGKTSILNKFLFKKFELKYKPTVEDLFCKDFDLGSIVVKVDFLDTSGSMQFPAMRRLSITTGSAFLIVYAVDDETSYDVLKMCVAEIREVRPDFQEIPIVFAGNKCDIPREKRKVTKEIVSNYVHYELPRLRAKVIECSCRDGTNIENIFRAYLSLARVSLSSAVSAGLRTRPGSAQLSLSQEEKEEEDRAQGDQKHRQLNSSSSTNKTTTRGNSSNEDRCLFAACPMRPQSMKLSLGIRKSCDASIIPARRGNPVVGASVAQGSATPTKDKSASAATATAPQVQQQQQQPQPQQLRGSRDESPSISDHQSSWTEITATTTNEVNLETAIQTKLTIVSQKAKPRSRSLIWRPSRKARATTENQDCRVS